MQNRVSFKKFASIRALSAVAAGLLLLILSTPGCEESPDTTNRDPQDSESRFPDTTGIPSFSGSHAFDMVEKQVAFGPRNPGSEGAARTLDFLVAELERYASSVERQSFEHVGYNDEKLTMTNVIASFNPEATTRVLLCAHWDTRPRGENDHDVADQTKPILGANDGGSGVGVLLEFARLLKENPPSIGVDIVLFDGEDYGDSKLDGFDRYFLGAKHFAMNVPKDYRPIFGILLDIVGDPSATFSKEPNSIQHASAVVELVWGAAAHLGLSHFAQVIGKEIFDDHLPLNQIARIPTIDIIDAELVGNRSGNPARDYWHTSDDTMDKISSETLAQVGRLLSYIVYRVVPSEIAKKGASS